MYNMSIQSEINREDLLNGDECEDDENEKLKDFYERNLQCLKEYPSPVVLADIARMIHKTVLNKEVDWMEYTECLGVTDIDVLDKIEERAKLYNEQPLFIVFTRVLPRKKRFDHVIRMLIEKNRFDVLRKIYPVAEGLIEKSRKTEVKRPLMIKPKDSSEQLTSATCSIHELDSETSSDCGNYSKYNTNTCVENHTAYNGKEFDDLQQRSMSDSSTPEIMNHDSTVFHGNIKQNISTEREIVPSAPPVQENPKENISVFIQHTEKDTDYAVQLFSKFKNAGFKVRTMSDVDVHVILAMNEEEALSAIFQEVDFVVPVISESFLKQIHATEKQFDSEDAKNNKYFYQLGIKEYKENNCLNYKVRPVIVPGMMKQKLKKDIVLSFPFRFGVEDDKLIRVLKETKELVPQYRLRNG